MLNIKSISQQLGKDPFAKIAGGVVALSALFVLWLVIQIVALMMHAIGTSATEVVRVYQAQQPLVQLLVILLVARILWVQLARVGVLGYVQTYAQSTRKAPPSRMHPVYTPHTYQRRTRTTGAYDPALSFMYRFPFTSRSYGKEAIYYGG